MKSILIVGNCQAEAMAKIIRASTVKWKATSEQLYILKQYPDQQQAFTQLANSVKNADIIICAQKNIEILNKSVNAIIEEHKKPDAVLAKMDTAFNDGAFEITDRGLKCSSAAILEKYATWTEHDLVMEYMNDRIDFEIHKRFQAGIQKTVEREKDCEIKIAPIIKDEALKRYRLFDTYNHPTDRFMVLITGHSFKIATGERLPYVAYMRDLFPGRYPVSQQEGRYFRISPDTKCFRKYNSELVRNWHRLRTAQPAT